MTIQNNNTPHLNRPRQSRTISHSFRTRHKISKVNRKPRHKNPDPPSQKNTLKFRIRSQSITSQTISNSTHPSNPTNNPLTTQIHSLQYPQTSKRRSRPSSHLPFIHFQFHSHPLILFSQPYHPTIHVFNNKQ